MKGKLFISPTFDELEEVSLDPHGDPRRLSEAQLKSVRQNGEFVVNSIHFPGQTHVWRLSEILQKVRLGRALQIHVKKCCIDRSQIL